MLRSPGRRASHGSLRAAQRMRSTAAQLVAALLLSCTAPAAAVRHLSEAPAPAPAATSSSPDNVTFGASFITEARFACPSNFRLVNDGVQTLYGPPDIIPNRTQVELAWLNATAQELVPQGICNRYVNYTAHPAQTPGLENFTALVEYYSERASSLPFSNPLDAQTTLFASQQMERDVSETWPSNVVLNWVRAIGHFNASDTTPLNITTIDTAEIRSTLQLQGKNLVPFTFDKQMLFIQTALNYFQIDNFPVGLMNFSNWQDVESTTSNSSAALAAEGIDTIQVHVWTTLIPYEEYTPQNLWAKVAAPDPRFWNATGAYGVPMNLTWISGTMFARPKGRPIARVTFYTTLGTGHSNTGRDVGIGVGVGAAVIVLVAIASFLYMRRRQRVGLTDKLSNANSLESPGSLPPLEGEVDPAEFVICRKADGSEICLGEGNFGKVYKAIRHGTTEVAIKRLTGVVGDKHTLYQLRKEIAILKKVSYDANIVQFYGACTTSPAMLVMEYMQGGDLRNALWRELHNDAHEFDWYNKGKDVALAVARGLNFLHNNNVVHRDVKSSNILLTRDGAAKVGDVGLAMMTDYFSSASAATGTFAYAAPEILMGKPTTSKVDSFSYGVVLWEIITKEQTQRGNWRSVRVPEECPAEVEELLQDCLTDDVDRRPSMKQIVERLTSISYGKPELVRESAPDLRDSADSLTQDLAKKLTS